MEKSNSKSGERKRKTYVPVGVLIESDKPRDDGQANFYIKLAKDTQVIVNGKDISGGYLQVSYPTDKFANMLNKGKITQEEYNQKVARFHKDPDNKQNDGDLSYIAFELNASFEE
jgi:hypothetical protein